MACAAPAARPPGAGALAGDWEDDYRIRYRVADSAWHQLPNATYLVERWDSAGRYLLARNAATNPADGGRFTRIDWVPLDSMAPWEWAFCLAMWDAPTADSALKAPPSDRDNPRGGCGGHPFSRMRRPPPDSAGTLPPSRYP